MRYADLVDGLVAAWVAGFSNKTTRDELENASATLTLALVGEFNRVAGDIRAEVAKEIAQAIEVAAPDPDRQLGGHYNGMLRAAKVAREHGKES